MRPLSPYAPPRAHLWDAWFARGSDGTLHMYHLRADSRLHPDERHDQSSIGHAELLPNGTWDNSRPIALVAGRHDEWDDLSLWTGSTLYVTGDEGLSVPPGGYMLYTGRNADMPLVQAIGLAKSTDMVTWTKVEGPVVSAGLPYSTHFRQNALGVIGAWRDPFLFTWDGAAYAAITARHDDGTREYNGCIGLATSPDLVHWGRLEPLLAPGGFDEMEVPQLFEWQGLWYLFFTCALRYHREANVASNNTETGWYCYISADGPFGTYTPANGRPGPVFSSSHTRGLRLIGPVGDGYGIKALGWVERKLDGSFGGYLSELFHVGLVGDQVRVRPL